jgi:hypothetical protein
MEPGRLIRFILAALRAEGKRRHFTAEARGVDNDGLSKPCPERPKFLTHQKIFFYGFLCVSVFLV